MANKKRVDITDLKQKKSDKEVEREFFGLIGTMIMDDMAQTSDLLQNLTGQIKYKEGFKAGYERGYLAAQANIRARMFDLDLAVGKVKLPEFE